jgi:2-iminobutanoate/2-iminopropanoate deaminase
MKAIPELRRHPKPLGPYSHAVLANGFVFISAQAPIRPGGKAGEWAAPDIAGQTRQCLENVASILEELGLTLASVVKTTVFLVDPADFQAMNEAYEEFFPQEPPARSPAKLGIENPGLKVAIEAVAVYQPKQDE